MATVVPLAEFSHDWVGGNIRGLRGIAQALYAYVPQVEDLVRRLSVVAGDLTADGPGGWQGPAAAAFTAAWRAQALTAAAVEDYVTAVALVIDGLAVELSQLENAVERQAADAAAHGVRIGADGTVAGYAGAQGLAWATAYRKVLDQALSEAADARQAAAQRLYQYAGQVTSANPHPTVTDGVILSGLLADLLAVPTAARREVKGKLDKTKGEVLKLKEEIAEEKHSGKPLEKTADELEKVDKELLEVQDELKNTGRLENRISKLLDTRLSNVRDFLAGEAGPGKHVGGNTPHDLQAAAEGGEPGALDRLLKFGSDIPVVDIGAALAGTLVGAYNDVQGGQSPGPALAEEAGANTAGTAAGAAAGTATAEAGADLGAFAGPAGIVAGALVGYGAGDLTHNLEVEPWTQDRQQYGVVLGTLYGEGHAEFATMDDARETAVGIGHEAGKLATGFGHEAGKLAAGFGHEVEHLWDDL
jgi:hypothetical protein